MNKILEKLFTKYFVFKIQEDWKEELKKIPEQTLKKWMDEELFVKINNVSESLAADVVSDCSSKWDNEIWMDINDWVNDYNSGEDEDELGYDVPGIPEDYWDSEDEKNPLEGLMMICPEKQEPCGENCDHAEPHQYESGCETGCGFSSTHIKCAIQEDVTDEKVPDEITETGEL